MIEHRSTDSSMVSDVPENCRRSWRQHTNLLCAANSAMAFSGRTRVRPGSAKSTKS